MEMSKTKLAVLEQLGTQIAQSEDAKKRIVELKIAHRNKLYGILLRYVREGWLKHDEFYTLLPPRRLRGCRSSAGHFAGGDLRVAALPAAG